MAGRWRLGPDWRDTRVAYRAMKRIADRLVPGATRLRIRGASHLPAEGAAILVSNHLSWIDPVVLGVAFPRPIHWLGKREFAGNPMGRYLADVFRIVPVDRAHGGNDVAIASAVDLLARGRVVGIFPEGTRSPAGEVRAGRTGVARLAALSGAPVVPAGCATETYWPRDRRLPRVGATVYLDVGAPMRLDLKPAHAEEREAMRAATDAIMARVRELHGEARAALEAKQPWR